MVTGSIRDRRAPEIRRRGRRLVHRPRLRRGRPRRRAWRLARRARSAALHLVPHSGGATLPRDRAACSPRPPRSVGGGVGPWCEPLGRHGPRLQGPRAPLLPPCAAGRGCAVLRARPRRRTLRGARASPRPAILHRRPTRIPAITPPAPPPRRCDRPGSEPQAHRSSSRRRHPRWAAGCRHAQGTAGTSEGGHPASEVAPRACARP